MSDEIFQSKLWTPRSLDETRDVYAKWAGTYDDDVTRMHYATPTRIAEALHAVNAPKGPMLDFGCGTGLSGSALRAAGFGPLDGTDISPEMLSLARGKSFNGKPLYRQLEIGTPGEFALPPADYMVVVATGVISLGAAPPETLDALLEAMAPDCLLAFSYNDPTLTDETYTATLDRALADGAELLFREHGPHLSEQVTGSDVIVLRRK